jgi:hypothetical protein
MKHSLCIIALLGLCACGVDGPPAPPAPEPQPASQTTSGFSIGGSFGIGVKR